MRAAASASAPERFVADMAEAWKDAPNRFTAIQDRYFRHDSVFAQPLIDCAVGVQEARESLNRLLTMIPDLRGEVVSWATEGDTAFVELEMSGTLGGKPISWRLADRFTFEGDRVVDRVTYFDSLALLRRQVLRARGWPRMYRARVPLRLRPRGPEHPRLRWPARGPLQPVADGVWRVTGGVRRMMNVYLVRDGSGVMLFDTGVKSMREAVVAAAEPLGGITRVVLGHAHVDHRGLASRLGVPVLCHPAERADAEGDAGRHYIERNPINPVQRVVITMLAKAWDAGPVRISATVEEGDEVAGFRVVHLPGHAPGQIALWREEDGLALTTDCFFTVDVANGRAIPLEAPPAELSQDIEAARASMRKLAALEPRAAWPGHGDPLLANVRRRLEQAADRSGSDAADDRASSRA